jgi:polysaccharide pyruvyl transferase WcaK-like protein
MMRILILRADGDSPNLGVRALKEGTESLIRRAFGDSIVIHVQNYNGGDSRQKFNRSAVLHDICRWNGPIKSTLRDYDVVVDVCGGDSFTDIYGLRRLALVLYTQRTSQRLRIPTILSPQTIGPFEGSIARRMASGSLKRMALVITRDGASVAESVSLGREPDAMATDVVFALPQPCLSSRRGVLVNVSGLLWNRNSHVDFSAYRVAVTSLVRSLRDQGHDVRLLAHVLDNPSPDNDVPAARALSGSFHDDLEIVVPTSLADARDIISRSELVIGSRMHACLNALSTGTPAIPWAYSRKFAPLLTDLSWSHLIDLRDGGDPVNNTLAILRATPPKVLAKETIAVRRIADERLDQAVTALSRIEAAHG